MAGSRPRGTAGLPPLSAADRQLGARTALFGTLPGRAIVVGLAVKLSVFLVGVALRGVPPFLAVVDTVAGVAIAAGAIYFLFRLLVLAKRRLLWRVRRKLILSYIFIGFVPAILIVGFFLLCGFLLFYNFSSYLVQSRLRALSDRARVVSQSTAIEIQRGGGRDVASILTRREANAVEGSGMSLAVVPVRRPCAQSSAASSDAPPVPSPPFTTAGPWAHLEAPRSIPAWLPCAGFSGVFAYAHRSGPGVHDRDTHMLVRAVAFPDSPRPGYAVVVDLLLDKDVRAQLQRDTGVELKNVIVTNEDGVKPLTGIDRLDPVAPADASRSGLLNNLGSVMEYHDWNTGRPGTLLLMSRLSVSDLYDRISSAEGIAGRSLGTGLLLALFGIGGLFLVIECIALVAGLALAKSITGSVHELFAGTERVRQGDFTHKIAVKTEDQLGELAGSFNEMTASIEDLLRQAAEKKRLEEELRIAREIQMSLLPQGPLVMPGLSLTALCVPAREVGGDYYDFFPMADNRLGVLIADVSGKGTSAALYMAELKGLVLSLSQIHTSPRDLLIAANRIIANNLDPRSFITMTYAVVDLDAARMTYARAGHTPMMYLPGPGCGASRAVQVLAPDGLVLGLKIDNGEMFDQLLVEASIPMHAGDLYVLFTDGITEAMNAADDCFGEPRLAQIVETHAALPSDQLRERVLREIEAFVGDAPQHDDMTMILLKVDETFKATVINAATAEHAETYFES